MSNVQTEKLSCEQNCWIHHLTLFFHTLQSTPISYKNLILNTRILLNTHWIFFLNKTITQVKRLYKLFLLWRHSPCWETSPRSCFPPFATDNEFRSRDFPLFPSCTRCPPPLSRNPLSGDRGCRWGRTAGCWEKLTVMLCIKKFWNIKYMTGHSELLH